MSKDRIKPLFLDFYPSLTKSEFDNVKADLTKSNKIQKGKFVFIVEKRENSINQFSFK